MFIEDRKGKEKCRRPWCMKFMNGHCIMSRCVINEALEKKLGTVAARLTNIGD